MSSGNENFDFGLLESMTTIFVLLAKPESTILIPIGIVTHLILSDLLKTLKSIKPFSLSSIYLIFGMVSYFQMVRIFAL
jgi:hypothetical protein